MMKQLEPSSLSPREWQILTAAFATLRLGEVRLAWKTEGMPQPPPSCEELLQLARRIDQGGEEEESSDQAH